jgi:CRP/FNR family transcriptional regulator
MGAEVSSFFPCDATAEERRKWINVAANLPVFERATTETVEQFLSQAVFRRYRPLEMIFRQGDPALSVFFLIEGILRVFQRSETGIEYTPKVFRAPVFFGDLPRLSGFTTERSSVEALVPSVLAIVPFDVLEQQLERDHGLCLSWLYSRAKQHSISIDADQQNVFGGLPARLANIILSYADVFGIENGDQIEIDHELTYQALAQHVGCSRRSAIMVMQKMIADGLVRRTGDRWVIAQSLRRQLTPNRLSLAYSVSPEDGS